MTSDPVGHLLKFMTNMRQLKSYIMPYHKNVLKIRRMIEDYIYFSLWREFGLPGIPLTPAAPPLRGRRAPRAASNKWGAFWTDDMLLGRMRNKSARCGLPP